MEPGVRGPLARPPASHPARRPDRPGPRLHAGLRPGPGAARCRRTLRLPRGRDLHYDSALTRVDSRTGHRYNTSGHFVWTGAHARVREEQAGYLATIRNPVGVALGPGSDADEAMRLLGRLDPDREPGRMTFQVRMGAAALRDRLPALVEKVTAEDHRVVWLCDPTPDGPRPLDDVVAEVTAFHDVHRALGTHPGGLTAELDGDGTAALELAFAVAELRRRS
ncbi:3-deoxy-7-phosphoheptulonate synthase [Streptomyces albus]